ncbi:CCA tRNA nucleotidyltransferase [Caldivirga maquilingensis]|uniref:CCA-adding enzyme n=1 Tax=Caldivirga maquilingensis (strain ATCC 700844 / DSM 13496 / JCM 10307 / IC-167) TaxID=397948 RepID=A8MDH3_CALMQ|nr:CCA tRNA nucleotidyltransferase [Caldivirga maquilingensis]ABW01829.1 tRNA cytidylyltransferase [Caldivirga maquilingensis IC-167]
MPNVEDIVKEALRIVTPSQSEVKVINDTASEVMHILEGMLHKLGLEAEVTLQGSIAHGTWLPGDRDIDVFLIFPHNEKYINLVKSGELVRSLAAAISEMGISWVMNYAQHPYLTLTYNGFNIDVVPCIRIRPGEKPVTAADRTPLHTLYLRGRLSGLEDDVRLLKLMMKRINVYGAEVKVQGFSGYLTELITLAYGGFINTLKAASRWIPFKVKIILEPSKQVNFNAPLVVIDPVDPGRNAAAAVSLDSMAIFIAASRRFLKKPSMVFFTNSAQSPSESLTLTTPTLILYGEYPKGYVEDIIWGQLRRIASTIWSTVSSSGFKPIDIGLYTPQDNYIVVMLTVEEPELPEYEIHMGPPVWTDEAEAFIEKYLNASNVVGPFIRNGRWFVIRPRRIKSIKEAVAKSLKTVRGSVVKDSLLKGRVVLLRDASQVNELPVELRGIALTFMGKRPHWLT